MAGSLPKQELRLVFLASAMAVFVENALQHAKGSPAAPWVCCAMQPGSRDVKLAVLDLGTSVSHSSHPVLCVSAELHIGVSAGHANLGTTSIYLQGIDTEEIIAAVHARRAPMMPASAGLQL